MSSSSASLRSRALECAPERRRRDVDSRRKRAIDSLYGRQARLDHAIAAGVGEAERGRALPAASASAEEPLAAHSRGSDP